MPSELTPANTAESPALAELPAGLTAADAERVMNYAAADLSEATRAAYAAQWKQFAQWAKERGAEALPADPGAVAAYLSERGPERSTSWLTQAGAAIRKAHEYTDLGRSAST